MIKQKTLYNLYVTKKLPLKEIAKICNVCISTVSTYVTKYGFPKRTRNKKIDKKTLYDLYVVEKLPMHEIGEKYGVDRTLIAYYARKYKFPKRNKTPIIRKEGEIVGDWTLIRKFLRNHHTIWECRCKCGATYNVEVSSLNISRSKSCKKCAMEKTRDNRPVPLFAWNRILYRKKNIPITITHDYVEHLWKQQNGKCALSGLPITFARGSAERSLGKTTASLDRIDSSSGYVENNLQWVHKAINNMKQSLTQEQFIYLCKTVAKFQETYDVGSPEIPNIRTNTRKFRKRTQNKSDIS